MTTPTRPLPPGVEIQRLETGWFPAIKQSDGNCVYLYTDGRWGLLPCGTVDRVNFGWRTETAAESAFWARHDAQPENQPKGEVRREPPGYIDGVLDGMDLCKPIIMSLAEKKKELTARVAALEAKAAGTNHPLPSPSAEPAHREPVVGMVYMWKRLPTHEQVRICPDGVVEFCAIQWRRSGFTHHDIAQLVASGELVPVPGYKVEVTP